MSLASNPLKVVPSSKFLEDGASCSLSIIDTTCYLTVPADTLIEPVIPGHELMNFPTYSFLIRHSTSGRQLLFDLGCRKDFWNLPSPIADVIDAKVPGIKVDENLVDILTEGGVNVEQLEAAVISHHHYDHVGDPSTFPPSMDLLVGPGFSANFLPGYPTKEASPVFENAFDNRKVREIDFDDSLIVGGYRAHDYFGDGSIYILDSPGHAIGHLSALVRTTRDTFVFLGGDICHFGGAFRPTADVPMPGSLSQAEICHGGSPSSFCDTSIFTACHPDPPNATTSPYYKPCSRSDSWYIDVPRARQSLEVLKDLDSNDRVLVLIAHDPAIQNAVPFFPEGTLNGWHEAGSKKLLRWRFLNELPVPGKPTKYLVDGTYKDNKRVKTLDGTRVQ